VAAGHSGQFTPGGYLSSYGNSGRQRVKYCIHHSKQTYNNQMTLVRDCANLLHDDAGDETKDADDCCDCEE